MCGYLGLIPMFGQMSCQQSIRNAYTEKTYFHHFVPCKTSHSLCPAGVWRILDFDYEMKLLGHVTQLVDSESWSFTEVPLSVCLQELGGLEPK